MFFFTNTIFKTKYALLLILLIVSSVSLKAQFTDILDHPDYFGLKKSPNTNRATKAAYDDNNNIYVGVWGSGVYKTTDGGYSWFPINSGLTNFYVTDIFFNKSGHLFVSTLGGGIFRSTNKGVAWTPFGTGLLHPNVKALGMYPNGWLFAGTYGGGMYISKDDGNKWTQSNNGLRYRDISSIAFSDAWYIVIGTYGGGIYASRDSGKTWLTQNTGIKNYYINDLVKNKTGSMFAASNGRGVLQSPNDGLSWAELDTFMIVPYTTKTSPLPDLNTTRVAVNKNNQMLFGSRYGGAFVYDDITDFTWVLTSLRATGINEIISDKSANLYAFPASRAVNYSNGIGEFWTDLCGLKEPTKVGIKDPLNPKLVILAKDKLLLYDDLGNFFISVNDGETWSTSDGLTQEINSVASDSSGNIFAATKKGLYYSDPSASNWSLVRFQDSVVLDVAVSPKGNIWVTTQLETFNPYVNNRNIFMSSDGGFNWIDKTFDLSPINGTPNQIVITSNNLVYIGISNWIYLGGTSYDEKLFFRFTNDNGNSWKTSDTTNGKIFDVSVGKNNIVYFSSTQGLYKSSLIGKFTKIPMYLDSNYKVYVDKFDNIYATGLYKLPDDFASVLITYRSTDGGSTFKVLNNSYNAESVTTITTNSDGDVYIATGSGSVYKSINPATLKAPALKNLADQSEDVPNNPTFNWGSVPKGELYQIRFSIDEELIYDFETVTLSDTSYQVYSNFFPNTKFWWRVRAKNHSVFSPWSEARTFISKLATPTLVAPDSNALGVSVSARMIWNVVDGASNYDILLSKSKNFTDTVMFVKDFTDTTKVSNILDGLTTYYWKVRAKSSKSTSYWSNVWMFKTVVGPPRLISPTDKSFGLMTSINFNWNRAAQATSYFIQISAKADFSEIINEASVNDTVYQYSGLIYDETNYWRVRSENKDGVSEYSDIWSYRTGYSPTMLDSPLNAKVNLKIPLALKWFKHETQNKYELYVANDSLFSKNLQKFENLDNVLEYTPAGLKNFTDYYWKVRVTSSENTGLWSEIRTFRTILGKSGLRMPADQSKGLPTEISFLWFYLPGADKYHLQIANDANFQDLVFSQDTIVNYSVTVKDLKEQSSFFWRVRGVNIDGNGEWSDVWSFSTSGNAPSLISPVNGKDKVKTPLTFKWQLFANGQSYKLQISKSDKFDAIAGGSDAIANTEYIQVPPLDVLTDYYWRVQANLFDGSSSDWSQPWSFTTDEAMSAKDDNIINQSNSYPNPFKDNATISFNTNIYSKVSIKIIDMSGKTLHYKDLGSLIPGNHNYIWGPIGLSSGVYYYIISIGKETIQGELIKE
jgi:photosystem II stability/assembly factor-like uncharacterized protein